MLLLVCLSQNITAQERYNGFDPQKFEIDLQQFIIKQVHLTPQESPKFFPLYSEMRTKQRVVFLRDRENRFVNPNDAKACERAIKNHDANELELKKIQQTYHAKFMKVLPANKVYQVIRAEDAFHRQAFRRAVNKHKR